MTQEEKSGDRDINSEEVLRKGHGKGEDGSCTEGYDGHTNLQFSQGEAVSSEKDVGTGESREKHVKMNRFPGLESALK